MNRSLSSLSTGGSSSLKGLGWGLVALAAAMGSSAQADPSPAPNIMLILVDDLAFTDLGVYGSEISTPNIDALAQAGQQFSNFRASPMCAPSRAMLMTGMDSHQTGLANLPETVPEAHVGAPGYAGHLEPQAITIATRLKTLGYRTYMTGKWHLGHAAGTLPSARGFDRTFIVDATGADNWEHRPYMPVYDKAQWFADGQATDLPENFYSSRFLVDQMLDYVNQDNQAPFFGYLSFLAVHLPVQAPREFVDRYHGRYDEGWEVLRARRQAGAKSTGVFPANAATAPMLPHLRGWDSLDAQDQERHAQRMEVYAAMVEAMDFHVGRLIEDLKRSGRYANTVFILTSDNGPEPADPFAVNPLTRLWFAYQGYATSGDNLGEAGTWSFIGPEFASAVAGPLSYFKFQAGEGGVRVPLIISGPQIQPGLHHGFSFITDIPATIWDLASGSAPPPPAHIGRSLVPVVSGQAMTTYDANTVVGFETAGQSGLYLGDYKLVRNWLPHGDKAWRLYNIRHDPGETQDLAATEPQRFQAMLAAYEDYRVRHGVLDIDDNYDPVQLLAKRSLHIVLIRDLLPLALGAGALLTLLLSAVWLKRRKRHSVLHQRSGP